MTKSAKTAYQEIELKIEALKGLQNSLNCDDAFHSYLEREGFEISFTAISYMILAKTKDRNAMNRALDFLMMPHDSNSPVFTSAGVNHTVYDAGKYKLWLEEPVKEEGK